MCSIFPCFENKVKHYWRKMGSISPCLNLTTKEIELDQKNLGENGQHFSFLNLTTKNIDLDIKNIGEKWAASPPVLNLKIQDIDLDE